MLKILPLFFLLMFFIQGCIVPEPEKTLCEKQYDICIKSAFGEFEDCIKNKILALSCRPIHSAKVFNCQNEKQRCESNKNR